SSLLQRPATPPLFTYTTHFRSVLLSRADHADLRRSVAHLHIRRASRRERGGPELPHVGGARERHPAAAPIDRRKIKVRHPHVNLDRKSTRLNSSHQIISYAVFC